MLDMIRYLVVWNPIILTAVHFAVSGAGGLKGLGWAGRPAVCAYP